MATQTDYSSYFKIHNRLDIDLQLKDDTLSHGHWEKKPNDGHVPAFTVSDEFQIQDPIGEHSFAFLMYR